MTGEEQETKIQLPKGFIFKIADAAKSRLMRFQRPTGTLTILVRMPSLHKLSIADHKCMIDRIEGTVT